MNKVFKFSLALLVPACMFSCNSGSNTKPVTNSNASVPHHEKYEVVIEQMKYNPANIAVNKGDTIFFTNEDIVAHNVTEVNKAWASPTLNNGDSWQMIADKSADYFCSIHLVMKGKITVR